VARGMPASMRWVALATLLLISSRALALDPSLDVSQYAHTAWRIRDGFPRTQINAIAQTADGYLWLGTELGLLRFDGVRAVSWQPAGEQLPSNFVVALLVARDGALWIGTLKGLARLDDGRLTTFPELREKLVLSLLQDREGTVWVGTAAPGLLCAVQAGTVHCEADGKFGRSVSGLRQDRLGNLWFAATTGVWRWKPGTPDHYSLAPSVAAPGDLIEDETGGLLVAATDGVRRLAGGKIESRPMPIVDPARNPLGLFRSTDRSLWIATLRGLVHVHAGRTDVFGTADGLSGPVIRCVFEDREKDIWIATSGGLDRFREYAFATMAESQGLSSSNSWAVQATPDGSVWIGTPEGLNRWKDGQVTFHGKQTAVTPGSSAPVLDGSARSLGVDDRGRLWAATKDAVLHLDGNRFVAMPGLPGGNVWSIAPEGDGDAWVSIGHGALYRSTRGGSVQELPWKRFGESVGALSLLPDPSPSGGLWLGLHEAGVKQFTNGEVTASYTARDGLGKGRVTDLRFGLLRTMWAATEGGLSRIRDGRVLTLTAKNGLPCDLVHWSIEDDDHFVWLYMSCGLVRVAGSDLDAWEADPRLTIHPTVFDGSDGVRMTGAVGSYGPRVTKAAD